MKYLRSYNESLRDYLKPKTEEDIDKSLDLLKLGKELDIACGNGDLEEVKKLIEMGVDPSYSNQLPLLVGCMYGHLEVVKELLKDRRVNPHDRDSRALQTACQNNHLEIVKELLRDNRVDPSARNNAALRRSLDGVNGEHTLIIKELLKEQSVIDKLEESGLLNAVKKYLS